MPWGNKGKRCNFTLRVAGNRCVSLSSLTRAARYGTMDVLWLRRNTSKYCIHYTTTLQDKTGDTRSSSSLLLNIKQMFPAESLHRYARYALSIPPTGKVKQTTLTWKHILGAERNPNSSKDFKTKLVLFICVCSSKHLGKGQNHWDGLGQSRLRKVQHLAQLCSAAVLSLFSSSQVEQQLS